MKSWFGRREEGLGLGFGLELELDELDEEVFVEMPSVRM